MPSNHLILCRPLLLLPSIFPNIRVFSNESSFRRLGQGPGASGHYLTPFACRPVPWVLWAGLQACQQTKFQYKWGFQGPQIQDTSSNARTP